MQEALAEELHVRLVRRVEKLVQTIRDVWRAQKRIDPYAIVWPIKDIESDDGIPITGAVLCPVPSEFDAAKRLDALQKLIERTRAYGLFFVEQKDNSILILFETAHGARSWYIPLDWHGDIQVPGQTEVKNNIDAVGLLWRKGSRH